MRDLASLFEAAWLYMSESPCEAEEQVQAPVQPGELPNDIQMPLSSPGIEPGTPG